MTETKKEDETFETMRSIGKEQLQYKPDISEVKNQKARAEKYRFYKIPTAFFFVNR